MSVLDRFLDVMHMNPDDDDYDDDYDDYDDDDYDDDDFDDDEEDEPSSWKLKRQAAAEAKAQKKEAKARQKEEAAREKERSRERARKDDFDDDDDRDYREERSSSRTSSARNVEKQPERYSAPASSRPQPQSKITPINKAPRKTGTGSMEVCVIKPTGIQDEIEICDTLLDGRTVIINMEGFDLAMAQRIIDFVSGAIYAMDGNLQKVSKYIFLATPRGVDISGDISEIVEQYDNGSSNYSF